MLVTRLSALSTASGSPGRIFLYSSNRPACRLPSGSRSEMHGSFCSVAMIFGSSSPNISIMAVFVPTPSARISTVAGTFLVRSTRT